MGAVNDKLTVPHTVGAGAIVGQGNSPELWCLYSTDDASAATPTWLDATAKVRAFSTSRGRENELSEIGAGTAAVLLDNRTRTFDPVINTSIRPLNRWWIREQFTGETQDIFKGYAESYDQSWAGMDAVTTVSCADEFKVLALDALAVTDPPRDTYADVVMFDEPSCYWQMNDSFETMAQRASVGPDLTAVGGLGSALPCAIVGDPNLCVVLTSSNQLVTPVTEDGNPEDIGGTSLVSLETWFQKSATPGGSYTVFGAPRSVGPNITFQLGILSTGVIEARARNSGGTTATATSAVLANGTWYHLVATVDGANLTLYVDGVQAAQTAFTGVFDNTLEPGAAVLYFGDSAASGITMSFDDSALYRFALPAARVAAHFTAGRERGFPGEQTMAERFDAVLNEIDSHAPRKVVPGTLWDHEPLPVFMKGQPPLEELRRLREAQNIDALLFTTRSGEVAIYGAGYRTSAPYNTVQATFDDDGTDLPYRDLSLDFSEAFLFNQINVTREGGALKTVSDTASIAKFFKRALSLTGLSLDEDGKAEDIADQLIVKYKDPMTRITALSLTTSIPAVSEALFALDIGDRIRVFRTAPGGGARIDQTLFVQKISVEGAKDGAPWSMVLGVSPF